ncbi:MAG: septal ring lytic transglycosylase RlpA family protein [bacterium]
MIRKILILLISVFILSGCGARRQPSYYDGKATMRPYRINGRTYYPSTASTGDTFSGIASWYGEDFHGNETSCGERYDMHELTAAHKTLPMNTMVRVTNKDNLKSTVVRINDRGPFVRGRIIDLSYAAAKKLEMVEFGTAPVIIEVVGFNNTAAQSNTEQSIVLTNFAVQVGAFHRLEGAHIIHDTYKEKFPQYQPQIKQCHMNGKSLYRVWLTGFQSEQEALDFIAMSDLKGAFIVRE